MEPKLAILFVLMACIIGLSHTTDASFGRMRRLLQTRRLRAMIRKI